MLPPFYFLLLINAPHLDLRLLPEPEPLNHRSVSLHVLAFHVIQKPPPLADQLQQAPPGVMVLLMGLEMFGQILNPGAEEGNLDLRRSRIFFVKPLVVDDSLSLFYI